MIVLLNYFDSCLPINLKLIMQIPAECKNSLECIPYFYSEAAVPAMDIFAVDVTKHSTALYSKYIYIYRKFTNSDKELHWEYRSRSR